jgi:predicted ArsR family transcriptional regulator
MSFSDRRGDRVNDELAARAAGIGALAEPVRRDLYRFVAAAAEPVSRDQAAAGVGVPVHTAKFHLDRLVAEGLLEVEFRRLTGRSGPGAGRPAKLYRRAAGEVSVSLPERRYDLAGHILAEAVERASESGADLAETVAGTARAWGRRLAAELGADPGTEPGTERGDVDRIADVLARQGYEPRMEDDELVLANGPFDALARKHTALVCGLNVSLVDGVVRELGCAGAEACLDPRPGLCCVRVRRRR